jgi:hypothetical protein
MAEVPITDVVTHATDAGQAIEVLADDLAEHQAVEQASITGKRSWEDAVRTDKDVNDDYAPVVSVVEGDMPGTPGLGDALSGADTPNAKKAKQRTPSVND